MVVADRVTHSAGTRGINHQVGLYNDDSRRLVEPLRRYWYLLIQANTPYVFQDAPPAAEHVPPR